MASGLDKNLCASYDLTGSYDNIEIDQAQDCCKNEQAVDAVSPEMIEKYHLLPAHELESISVTRLRWQFILEKFHINESQTRFSPEHSFSQKEFELLLHSSTEPSDRLYLYSKFRGFLQFNVKLTPFNYSLRESFTDKIKRINLEFKQINQDVSFGKLQRYLNWKFLDQKRRLYASECNEPVSCLLLKLHAELMSFFDKYKKIDYLFFKVNDVSEEPGEVTRIDYKKYWDSLLLLFKEEDLGAECALYPLYMVVCEEFLFKLLSCAGINMEFEEFMKNMNSYLTFYIVRLHGDLIEIKIEIFFSPSQVSCHYNKIKFTNSMSCLSVKMRLSFFNPACITSMLLSNNSCGFSALGLSQIPPVIPTWLLAIPYQEQSGFEFDKYLTYFPYEKKPEACLLLNTLFSNNKTDIERIDAFEQCRLLAMPEYHHKFIVNCNGKSRDYKFAEQCLRFTIFHGKNQEIVNHLSKEVLAFKEKRKNNSSLISIFDKDFDRNPQYLKKENGYIRIRDKNEILTRIGINFSLINIIASQETLLISLGVIKQNNPELHDIHTNYGGNSFSLYYYEFINDKTVIVRVIFHRDINLNPETKQTGIMASLENGVTAYRSLLLSTKVKLQNGRIVNFENEMLLGPALLEDDDSTLPEFDLKRTHCIPASQGLADSVNWFCENNRYEGLNALSAYLDITNPHSVRVSGFNRAKALVSPLFSVYFRYISSDELVIYKILAFELTLIRRRQSIASLAGKAEKLSQRHKDNPEESARVNCSRFIIRYSENEPVIEYSENEPVIESDAHHCFSVLSKLLEYLRLEGVEPLNVLADSSFVVDIDNLLAEEGMPLRAVNKLPSDYQAVFYIEKHKARVHVIFDADMKKEKAFSKWRANHNDTTPYFKGALDGERFVTYRKYEVIAEFDPKTQKLEPKEVIYTDGETLARFNKVVNKSNLHRLSSGLLKQSETSARVSDEARGPEQINEPSAPLKLKEKIRLIIEKLVFTETFSEASAVFCGDSIEAESQTGDK